MNKTFRLVAASTFALASPLVAIAPATAMTVTEAAALQNVFNCNTMLETGQIVGLWDGTATVALIDCDGLYLGDQGGTDNAYTTDGIVPSAGDLLIDNANETLTFDGETEVTLLQVSGDGPIAGISAQQVLDMGDPNGVRMIDDSITIGMDAETFTVGTDSDFALNTDNDPGNDVDVNIDGDVNCGVLAGEHVYTLQRFHVTESGEYTFRVVGTDPVSSYIQVGNYTPLEDPMIALYEGDFDPMNADSAVSGCNDDFNDLVIDGFDWSVPNDPEYYDRVFAETTDAKAIEGHFPVFTTDLQPGDYTMLVTTYWTLSSDEWAAGENPWGTWEPGAASVDYEVWGPESGLEAVDEFALAATGVDPSFGLWSGIALAGTGVAITVARRRAQRA